MLENGGPLCNCKHKKCVRHGNCVECIKYHENTKRLPYCKRSKSILLSKLFTSANKNNK